ncbi:MAG: hypothetical protein H7336_17005 [Bacteriovorax sp.]|nr:hypothetical protein [Bacteriovorax sp.]
MKSMMLALALLAGLTAHASTIDGYSLPITGVLTEENFAMSAVQTRTEYRNETVANTCFRTVQAGYRTECRQEPQVVCYPDPHAGQVCTTRFENRCYTVPQYRQEAYTCYQTVSVPHEVFSNNVKANVNVKVSSVPGDVQAPHNTCGVDFTLTGGDFKSVANCSEFIVLAKTYNEESRVGDTVTQNRSIDLTLLDAKKLSAPTKGGIVAMKLEGQTVVFRSGDLTKNPNFSLKLFVQRRKLFKGDETLISRNLTPSEYSFEKISDDFGIVKINLSKLIGGINEKRKHVIRVDLNIAVDTTGAINSKLPSFSASESIIVNN